MSYEEIKTEIKNAPMSYLPGLLVCVVEIICEKKALKHGGAARIAKSVEEEHTESAASTPNTHYRACPPTEGLEDERRNI